MTTGRITSTNINFLDKVIVGLGALLIAINFTSGLIVYSDMPAVVGFEWLSNVLIAAAIATMAITVILYLFLDIKDKWTPAIIIIMGVLSVLALGVIYFSTGRLTHDEARQALSWFYGLSTIVSTLAFIFEL